MGPRPLHVAAVAVAIALAAPAAAAPPAAAPTAEELARRNVEARGGAEAIRSLSSLRLTGKVVFGGDDWSMEMTWTRLLLRPGMIRTETSAQGMTAMQAWDGAGGWRVSPFGGRKEPERMPPDAARPLALDADLDGPLLGWKEKGGALASLGTEDVDGTLAHKLQLTRADGTVQVIYLDPDQFLEIRVETRTRVRGAEVITERDLGNYERVAGVWMPFAIEIGEKGGMRHTRISIERAEPGIALDPALFRFPEGGTPLAGPPPARGPAPAPASSQAPRPPGSGPVRLDEGVLSGLPARNVGSAAMSGRISAIAAHGDGGKTTLFAGAASGGVWKSTDGGTTFRPVFDHEPVQSIGAIAVDPREPRNVWVGTGEAWTRNSVSVGNGIYRSTDGGETWVHVGLPESERVARIVVDPRSSDVVWACVPGKLWADSPDRGLYRTADGGRTWTLALPGKNLSTGCSSVSLDPKDPDRILAGMWDFRRAPDTFRSGGDGPAAPSGSGLFRSEDGGRTWIALEPGRDGLPAAPWGRIEVVHAPSDSRIVYAFVEATASGLFRSADGGRTWEARDRSFDMVWRPFYFARLVVDPQNPDRLFKTDLNLIVSEDGGRSFASTGGGSHGDWHDLWIDPRNPRHVVGGDDGGLWISHDGGSRWWKGDNLPISQFYHVSVDAQDPYRVYGGLQDNGSWSGPSSYPWSIPNATWDVVNGSDGFWVLVDPTAPDVVYAEGQGGYVVRFDRRTRALRDIQPKAGYGEKLRFNWNTPMHLSTGEPGTLYLGAQFLLRTRDRGETWERISPDLTTNDPALQRQELSGGITVDNSSAEMHTTIYAIAESPRDSRRIWVGTDDGNLQVTRDGGRTWENVAPRVTGLPPRSWVSWVEPSRFDADVAYAAFDRHAQGDMAPWVYRTGDGGRTWTRIAGPEQGVRGYVHVVREDPVKPSLLYLGTELGLWISVDGGASWAAFRGGRFPAVAVRDLAVHPREHDLVIATHGRGIWIVDDLTALRALSDEAMQRPAAVLPGRPSQQRMGAMGSWVSGDASWAGESAPSGVVITFYQRERHLFGPLRVEILDADGKVVDTVAATKRRGLNRVTWSGRLPPPRVPRAAALAGNSTQGPRVLPGTWTVRLVKGTESYTGPVEVALDRRAPYGLPERKEQLELALRVQALFARMSDAVDRIQALDRGARARAGDLPAGDALGARLLELAARSEALRGRIVATKEGGAITGEERLREHADILYGAVLSWDGRPPATLVDRTGALERELGDVVRDLDALTASTLPAIDRDLAARGLPAVTLAPPPAAGRTVSSAVVRAGFQAFDGEMVSRVGKHR
ncbi:MAG TPA: hypothetical protein VFM53_10280 [Anaeromyxobacteraceae bacterium]|nr:hypothetical protein [Anaeromyxobacteraceae bacterium]